MPAGVFSAYQPRSPPSIQRPAPSQHTSHQTKLSTPVRNPNSRYLLGLLTELANATIQSLGRGVGSILSGTMEESERQVDLVRISSAAYHGCMGLPQELIDYITDILHDDLRTLKACSLTCKAMFASARHLIHQTLHLTRQNNEKVLTQEEICQGSGHRELRFVSYMGECGLLQYTRQVHVRDPGIFVPETLLPHIHYFQSLDRVHTLAIEHYDAVLWAKHYKTCFVHLYPTLTSLTLNRPFGRCRALLRFALQFPNLENLCFEWLRSEEGTQPPFPVPPAVGRSPSLRGHLRLAFSAVIQPSEAFVHEFRKGVNFRSVEFESDFYDTHAQHILNAFAHTLENLTIASPGTSTRRLSFLSFHMAEQLANFLRQDTPSFTASN